MITAAAEPHQGLAEPEHSAPVVPIRNFKGRRLAFMNNKGGVGKTTTTRELAAALARAGNRVLVVDMDPQANITRRLGVRPTPGQPTILDALTGRRKGGIADIIVPCGWDIPDANLIDVAPSDLRLDEHIHQAHQPGFDKQLKRILFGVTDGYDYTLFDCHPSMGPIEQLAVAALDMPRDGVYIVIEPGHDAISGASRVIDIIADWADRFEVRTRVRGVIVNLVREKTNLHQARTQHLPASLHADGRADVPILSPHIPNVIHLAEAQDLAHPSTTDPRLTRDVTDATGLVLKAAIVTRFDRLAQIIDNDDEVTR